MKFTVQISEQDFINAQRLHMRPGKARRVFHYLLGIVLIPGLLFLAAADEYHAREAPLTSYLAAVRCVHYSLTVEEEWSRLDTETSTDSSFDRIPAIDAAMHSLKPPPVASGQRRSFQPKLYPIKNISSDSKTTSSKRI